MEGGLFEAPESFGDLRGGDVAGFLEGFAGEKLGEDGRAGKSADATLRFEARLGDCARVDLRRETKNVSADRIRYLNYGCGIRQIAGIPRILEMVENGGGVHRKKVYR